jgi:hypothetical protein
LSMLGTVRSILQEWHDCSCVVSEFSAWRGGCGVCVCVVRGVIICVVMVAKN